MSSTPRFRRLLSTGCPVFGALVFTHPHTKNVLFAVQINTDGDVNGFLNDLSFTADVEVDGVQKYDRVDALQRPLLQFFCHGQNFVRDSADGGVGHLHAVDVMDMSRNNTAFAAFVTGFRLAAGIAYEHYSFYDEAEMTAQLGYHCV